LIKELLEFKKEVELKTSKKRNKKSENTDD